MDRYQGVTILSASSGRRYYQNVKYPDIPMSSNDIYVITDFTDRLDLIANDYYNDPTLWWVISVANAEFMPADSLYVPAGIQLRIPNDIQSVIQDFNTLNGIS